MIIFLRPGEQVEIQFVAEASTTQPFKEAVVVKHAETSYAKVGIPDEKGFFVEKFKVHLSPGTEL